MPKQYPKDNSHLAYITLRFDNETIKAIEAIARASHISRERTIYILIETALAYNFNRNLEYLCCTPQNIPYSERPKSHFTNKISFAISKKYVPILEKLNTELGLKGLAPTIRYLVCVALEHDYNERLMFRKPTPIDFSDYSPIGFENLKDFILLDKI